LWQTAAPARRSLRQQVTGVSFFENYFHSLSGTGKRVEVCSEVKNIPNLQANQKDQLKKIED
jgi:hypothetical protein